MDESTLCTGEIFIVSPADVFDRYADMVYRLAFAKTGNRSDADDILQDVFLRYLRAGCQVKNEEHLKALLLRMTVNSSKNLLTSVWYKRTDALREDNPAKEQPTSDTLDAVLKLPEKYRVVIHLHYYCGYLVEEIADILKTNPSTIKSRLMRARQKLKESLKEDL